MEGGGKMRPRLDRWRCRLDARQRLPARRRRWTGGATAPCRRAWRTIKALFWALCLGSATAHGVDCEIASFTEPLGEGTTAYQVAGSGPDVLLLHGLFAQKEQWNDVLCTLANAGYRASALDLPGYGQSKGYPVEVYALENQVALIDRLMQQRGITRVHLAGNSMGGAIAALYARSYPQHVASLAFIGGTLGIGEWAAPVRQAIVSGVNPFIPLAEAQLDLELRLLLTRVPELPPDAKQAMIAAYIDDQLHHRQVWDIVNLYGNALRSLPANRLPTLIVWGKQDLIFDVAGVQPLVDKYPASRQVLLDGVGHLPMLDAPALTARIYIDFLRHSLLHVVPK